MSVDLELNDFDLKPYMDPNILLDTFSPDDMDIWQSYNLFTDDNINSSIKDQIKEENTDLMDCFTSICPNDLLNTVEQHQMQQQINQMNYNQSEEYYSSSCSSSSPSSSSLSADHSPNIFDDTNKQQVNNINLDTINFIPCMLNQANNYEYQNNDDLSSSYQSFDQICNSNNSSDSCSLSASSNQDIYSVSCNNKTNSFVINNDYQLNQIQIQKSNQQQLKIVPAQNLVISTQLLNQNNQPIILVESNASPKTVKQLSTNSQQIQPKVKKANVLPPSPPSSFDSDSESNQSTVIVSKKSKSRKESIKASISKLNNPLRNSSMIKQMRNQSYSSVKSKHSLKNKSTSLNNSNNNNNNSNCNSDDDCWPFLCSLSKLPSSGPILLTEEEKRTLVQEGHQVPSQLPLSKGEEKILKKIRRKIKNKISAQESRRKKKEYVDSLEKRMENYISQNVELRKRLEDLELNNKNLLTQLQKIQTSITQTPVIQQHTSSIATNTIISDYNDEELNFFTNNTSNSTNQFGTLLMVLVLFFAVVLGVWSPVFTKDQMTHSAAASAAAATAANSRAHISQSVITTTTSATTAAVAVAAAFAVAGNNVATVKTESVSPTPSPLPGAEDDDIAKHYDEDHRIRPLSPYATPNIKSRVLLSLDDDYDDTVCDIVDSSAQLSATNNLIARSKTGTAVELTKVRPFIRKLPDLNKTSDGSQSPDYVLNSDENQIIVLNLSNNQNSLTSIINNSKETDASKLNINLKANSTSGQMMSSANYRVINTANNNNKLTGGGKIMPTTRFRLVNNSIANVVSTYTNIHQRGTNAPSIIKLNSF